MKKNRKGFTIVELVIVIAVIAILAAVLIPTFSNLIDKANMSVDEQLVAQMNKVLSADQAANNKPNTVVDAQKILKENGIANFKANLADNTVYWVASDNKILLWSKGKVAYPADLANKYKSLTEPSQDWYPLANSSGYIEYETVVVEPAEGETLENALLGALSNAGVEDSTILSLPANSEVTFNNDQLDAVFKAMKTENNVGKEVTLDLNGSTLNATKTDGWPVFEVPAGGTLEIVGGTLDITNDKYKHSGFQVDDGASLVLRDVTIDSPSSYAFFFPASTASEIIIENCNIKTDAYYGMMTNGETSANVRVVIKNTTFIADASHGILMNVPCNVHIENSTISASNAAVTMRAGSLNAVNSTFITTSTAAGAFNWKEFTHFDTTYGYWGTGNALAGGVLTLGDHSKSLNAEGNSYSYQGDINCTLDNVVLETKTAEIPAILIGSRVMKNVNLTCDEATAAKAQLYNWPHKFGHGTVTINGATQTFTDDKI